MEIHTDADIPQIVKDLTAEWYEVTWEDGEPVANQLRVWKEHIKATRSA